MGIGAVLERERGERGPHVVVPAVPPTERRKILWTPAIARVVIAAIRIRPSWRTRRSFACIATLVSTIARARSSTLATGSAGATAAYV